MSGIKTGVIGHPVSHSKSPLIHNYWIKKYNLTGSYDAIDIAPEKLNQGLRDLKKKGYAGLNLTLPHKELAVPMCDEIDETARAVGAVNTVIIKDGKISGTNTDVFGFAENIKQNAPGFKFSAGPAVVLGAGGAARAVVYALLQEGVKEIRLTNRTVAKAEELAQMDSKITAHEWEDRAEILEDANLLVNTTLLGMKGQEPLKIDLEPLPKTALVNDIVYAPLKTDLLRKAATHGNKTVTGIGMLLHQARPGFRLWHGVMPEVDEDLTKMVLA